MLLPTLYFLFQADAESHGTLGKLMRVGPTFMAFVSLLAYGSMVAVGGGIRDWGSVIGPTPRRFISPLRSLIAPGAAGVLIGAVLLVGAAWPDNRVTVCITGDQASQSRKSAEVLPRRPQLWVDWGRVLSDAQRYGEAADVLKTSLGRDPDFAPTHQALARVLWAQGDLPAAVAQFQRAGQLDPNDAECHAGLGAVLLEQGDLGGAKRESQEALRLNPHLGEALKTLNLIRAAPQ